ncbi:MAG: TlpA family protein disulfide reductase [Armatimonadetes bacterium]|nr:TlpA family protein disulfide reductase [Armatimonadota bacterium]CUU34777.1 Thiol-disulfide isomerase or thioredoxin [Armatimonadetes bacterium DC]
MRIAKAVGFLLAIGCVVGALALQERGLPKGTQAPDFELQTLDGKTVTLSKLRGKPVLLDFWATWCGPCRRALPHTQELAKRYKDQAYVLTVNLREDPETVRAFMENNNYTFPVLLDRDGSVAHKYGVRGIPHFVIIDAQGKIFHNQVGYGPGVEKELERKLKEAFPKNTARR